MNHQLLIYPSIAMICLTLACVFAMGYARFRAIRSGEVSIRYFRSFDEGTQPKRLHLISRHVQNHFEIPPLFHIAIVLTIVCDATSVAALIFAWLFVAARCLHSAIHLGRNNVSQRFFVFGFSLLMLVGLIGNLAVALPTQ